MSAFNYFEQFAGDPLVDHAPLEKRLVYLPTGEYILFDDAQSFHKQAQILWEKIGTPQMWMGSFISNTSIECWAYGQLIYESKQ